MTSLAVSANALWAVSLGIALVAALIVAFLLIVLVRAVDDIDRSATGLLEVAGNTANIPKLEATAPVLGLIVEEAVVQDRYMSALTDGYGES